MRIIVGLVMVLLASSVPASAQSPSQLPSLSTSGSGGRTKSMCVAGPPPAITIGVPVAGEQPDVHGWLS